MNSEMPQPSRSSLMAAAPALASQAQSMPPAGPFLAAVASKADRRENSALAKAVEVSVNIVNAFIRGQGGQPVSKYSSIS